MLSQETKKLSSGKISVRAVFDSGKIFKIFFFSRGPRTPYCTRFREVFRHTFKQIVIVLKVRKKLFRLGFTWYTMLRQIPLTHEFMLQLFAPAVVL